MTDVALPVTSLLTITLVTWLLILSWRVIRHRRSGGASLGDGGDVALQRKIRAQANLTEYAPLFVLLIGATEIQGGNTVILAVLSCTFVLGRLAHGYAFAFTSGNMIGRVGGMGLTLVASGLAVTYALIDLIT